jgi:hypothetical protein
LTQDAPGLMNRPLLWDLVARATGGAASWPTPPGILAFGTALPLPLQFVEPDLDTSTSPGATKLDKLSPAA